MDELEEPVDQSQPGVKRSPAWISFEKDLRSLRLCSEDSQAGRWVNVGLVNGLCLGD